MRMRKVLSYPGGSLEFPIEDDRVVAVWRGPTGGESVDVASCARRALEAPIDLPPLSRCVVPGDRVVIAFDPAVPDLATVLSVVINVLEAAGVEREGIVVLATDPSRVPTTPDVPAGVAVVCHQADDPKEMAYLAATEAGRRVHLNRLLVDADFVMSIGTVARDSSLGWSGPWATIFPGLSDRETRQSYSTGARSAAQVLLRESSEVGWLLGNQFQIGVIPGTDGVAAVLAGLGDSIRLAALSESADAWTFRVDRRADLVVVGTTPSAGLEATWSALATGAKLARRGGKVVALSDATGPIGPATLRLLDHEERGAAGALRGAESEPDYAAARDLAEALDWADLYLLSDLDDDEVEELGLIPLGKATEALRLAASATDVILVSHAEKTVGIVAEDSE